MYNKVQHYFLGANSRYGFHSLYDDITHPERGDFLWIIKGGPGCGKSSFMRRIGKAAEAHGERVEYILCSGDPDSLDGVILPDKGLAWVDGTAPHAQDTAYPAGSSLYLDLGRFYDADALRPLNSEIMDINRRYKSLYTTAYARISAAACVLPRCCVGFWGEAEKSRILKKLDSLARRELRPVSDRPGRASHRFLSATSCRGRMLLPCPAQRVWLLDNELGLAHFYIKSLSAMALERGYDLILCHDSLDPKLLSGLIIPHLDLAILAPEPDTAYEGEISRRVHLDAMADREEYTRRRAELRQLKKLSLSLLDTAVDTLAQAKAMHDQLEAIYNPHVDFTGVYAQADAHIRRIFE